jgi:hypothetical protein
VEKSAVPVALPAVEVPASEPAKDEKVRPSSNSIEKALNPDFANIGFSPVANIGNDDDELKPAVPQGEGKRIEILGRGKYWQWRWGRIKGQSRYGGTFDTLPDEARKRKYKQHLATRRQKTRANKR